MYKHLHLMHSYKYYRFMVPIENIFSYEIMCTAMHVIYVHEECYISVNLDDLIGVLVWRRV